MNKLGAKFGAIAMSAVMALTFAPAASITSLAAEDDLADVRAGVAAVYRLYNPNSGEHLFTVSTEEKDNLLAAGWEEGNVAWMAPVTYDGGVYRLYNPNAGDHHYTMDKNEADTLVDAGWLMDNDGIPVFHSANPEDPTSAAVYCLYNPNAYALGQATHHYTADLNEYHDLVDAGWIGEDVKFYGYPVSVPSEVTYSIKYVGAVTAISDYPTMYVDKDGDSTPDEVIGEVIDLINEAVGTDYQDVTPDDVTLENGVITVTLTPVDEPIVTGDDEARIKAAEIRFVVPEGEPLLKRLVTNSIEYYINRISGLVYTDWVVSELKEFNPETSGLQTVTFNVTSADAGKTISGLSATVEVIKCDSYTLSYTVDGKPLSTLIDAGLYEGMSLRSDITGEDNIRAAIASHINLIIEENGLPYGTVNASDVTLDGAKATIALTETGVPATAKWTFKIRNNTITDSGVSEAVLNAINGIDMKGEFSRGLVYDYIETALSNYAVDFTFANFDPVNFMATIDLADFGTMNDEARCRASIIELSVPKGEEGLEKMITDSIQYQIEQIDGLDCVRLIVEESLAGFDADKTGTQTVTYAVSDVMGHETISGLTASVTVVEMDKYTVSYTVDGQTHVINAWLLKDITDGDKIKRRIVEIVLQDLCTRMGMYTWFDSSEVILDGKNATVDLTQPGGYNSEWKLTYDTTGVSDPTTKAAIDSSHDKWSTNAWCETAEALAALLKEAFLSNYNVNVTVRDFDLENMTATVVIEDAS